MVDVFIIQRLRFSYMNIKWKWIILSDHFTFQGNIELMSALHEKYDLILRYSNGLLAGESKNPSVQSEQTRMVKRRLAG